MPCCALLHYNCLVAKTDSITVFWVYNHVPTVALLKACGSQSDTEDRWPWPRATSQRTGGALCGGTYMQDVRARGVATQQRQAVLLSRAFLVNLMAVSSVQ